MWASAGASYCWAMGSLQRSGTAVGRRRGWQGESLHMDADEVSGGSFEVPPKECAAPAVRVPLCPWNGAAPGRSPDAP